MIFPCLFYIIIVNGDNVGINSSAIGYNTTRIEESERILSQENSTSR